MTDLVRAAQGGDREAFEELVRATFLDTHTLARRLTANEEDALDVVQDTYLRAWRSIGTFRGDAQFSTWLYRITANCASTHMKRRRRVRWTPLESIPEPAAMA
ncbi:MAG: RNA polymerase sigma factor, partial [Actinomycetes bacterium]